MTEDNGMKENSERTAPAKDGVVKESPDLDTSTRESSRRNFLRGLAATGGAGTIGSELLVDKASAQPTTSSESGWEPKTPPLDTPWTDEVGPDRAHPEYPRPQLVREDWKNLNGVWQFAPAAENESPPIGQNLNERILVPYPVESALSGIKRHEPRMWYRRTFSVPNSWLIPTAHPGRGIGNNPNSQRLLLHFEAVDWEATIYVNGQKVKNHKGGYDSFTVDITDALTDSGEQELVVGVYDPTDNGTQAIGKQVKDPHGFFQKPNSGIWQTVWLEPVPETHINDVDMTPDIDEEVLRLTVNANTDDATVVATAFASEDEVDENKHGNKQEKEGEKKKPSSEQKRDGKEKKREAEKIGQVAGPANEELELALPDPHLWSPEDPFLYDLEVELRGNVSYSNPNNEGEEHKAENSVKGDDARDGKSIDIIESYFGMRSIGKKVINGKLRPTLNGEFVFHLSPLDQGYWPDGVYTAPTDEALRFDLEKNKELGFNANRKHVKVESKRWFYWADKLGVLVWQDMPNISPSVNPDNIAKKQFEQELREMVTEHNNHPSVAVWVPFNEGWGVSEDENTEQWIDETSQMVSELDSERLVDAMSGQNICDCGYDYGDVIDIHFYPGPTAWPPNDTQIAASGEYNSAGILSIEDHIATEPRDDSVPNVQAYVDGYVDGVKSLKSMMEHCGLSASVFTSLVDVGREHHGLITYDRRVVKPVRTDNGLQHVQETNANLIKRSKNLANNPPDDPPSGPREVGFWPFNEGSGTTASDEAGDNDAILVNEPTWTSGQANSALRFDGTTNYVDTGATVLDTTQDYTVAAWVQVDDLTSFQTAVSQGAGLSAFFLQYLGGQQQFAFTTPSGIGRAVGGPTVQKGKWYHIVGTFSCEEGIELYVNGNKEASLIPTAHPSDGNLLIGRATAGGNPIDFWKGKIDQVHAYQSALSSAEISQLYTEEGGADRTSR